MVGKFFKGGKVLFLAVSLLASPIFAGPGSVPSNADGFPGLRTLFPAFGAVSAAADKGPVIRTEKADYLAAETVSITGFGFRSYERVRFAVGSEVKTRTSTSALIVADWEVSANARGGVSTSWIVPSEGGSYMITATGTDSGKTAKTTVTTDSLVGEAVALEQCQNGTSPANDGLTCVGNSANGGWVTGNVNSQKAQFAENQFIPYRMVFTNLIPGRLYSFTLGYDITKAGQNAVDYLGTYNHTVTNANPCADGSDPDGNCLTSGTPVAYAIPYDDATLGGDGPGGSGDGSNCSDPADMSAGCVNDTRTSATAYPKAQIAGDATIWGGEFVEPFGTDPAIEYGTVTCASGGTFPTGTCSQFVKFWFRAVDASPTSAASGTVVIAVGAHIGARTTWGVLNGAVGITGSPYHGFKQAYRNETDAIDLNVGSGDIQLAVDAVTLQGSIEIFKHASPPSSFAFTFSGDFDADGYTAGSQFELTDTINDPGHVPGSNNPAGDPGMAFTGIIDYAAPKVVSELSPSPYTLQSIFCETVVAAGLGTSTFTPSSLPSASGGSVSIDLSEGDTVRCTFFNDFTTAAEAQVEGRVTDINGSPIAYAWVSGTDANGTTRSAMTNQFGYYSIRGLEAGTSLFFNVSHKSYNFGSQFVTLEEEVTTLDFTGVRR